MRIPQLLLVATLTVATPLPAQDKTVPANPEIDMEFFLRTAAEAARHRSTLRVTEKEFARMSRDPGTLVLDARSRQKDDELHVKGAVNLTFAVDIRTTRLPFEPAANLEAARRVR